VGFEPTTPGLKVRSSTAELRALEPQISYLFGRHAANGKTLADRSPLFVAGGETRGRLIVRLGALGWTEAPALFGPFGTGWGSHPFASVASGR
jgi:hypothetical protein